MADQIMSKEKILAEFDRIKAGSYEFSDEEICILVAANLGVAIEAARRVCIGRVES
jgi:hypothetical protein